MAPIPPIKKKKRPQQASQSVSTDNVYDDFGRSMSYLLQRQRRTNQTQEKNVKIAREHATKNDNQEKASILFRDVFPAMKYKIFLSTTSWIDEDNPLVIGYNVGDTFTQLYRSTTAPDEEIVITIPDNITSVDTVEVKVKEGVQVDAYMEDGTQGSSIIGILEELLEDLTGLSGRVETLEGQVADLEERVAELENNSQ